jgi:hypothetical protein
MGFGNLFQDMLGLRDNPSPHCIHIQSLRLEASLVNIKPMDLLQIHSGSGKMLRG